MNIFRQVVILVAALLCFGCTANDPVRFTIAGTVKNPLPGKIILTQEEDINRKKSKFIDSIELDKNGRFRLDLSLEPHIYKLNFYDRKSITMAIGSGQQLEIEADGKDLEKIKVTGSEDTAKLRAYEQMRKESLERLVISVRDRLKALGNYNNTEAERDGADEILSYEKHKAELNRFIETKIGDSIALYSTSLRWDGEENIPLFKSLAKAFEKRHGNLEITKRIKEKIELLERTGIGGKAAGVVLPDKDGKPITLDSTKSRYTLVDFWASWCGPCRRESKIVSALYEKYKNQGLEIYGISLDDDRSNWLDAIETDGRSWPNVSSLNGFETPAAFDYGVTALPAKFLIDSEGKIVAKNLHGSELKKKVEEIMTGQK